MNYEQLKTLVTKHSHLYYDLSAPEITDAAFDELYSQLEAIEKAQGWKSTDSPTVLVGGSAGKVKHLYRLYSLRKEYSIEEIDDFYDVITPKIDGANLSLIYRYGKLKLALTRGNGEYGDNILHLAKHISNIPLNIQTQQDIVVINGECVTDKQVDNYRNYVSGALGLKSAEDFKTRDIKFVAHDMLNYPMNYTKRMAIVENMGFFTVLSKGADSYPQDGLVYRLDDYKKCELLGYTSKYPKFAVALKEREVETAITTLQDVVWAIGRTGTVNPTGIISPVILDDATISRVTLHNISIIEEFNLGLGDTIEIERAGGVIPKFLRVIEHAKHGLKITKEHAELAVNTKVIRNGPKLVVSDKATVNTAKILEHFVKTLEIKGLGPANIAKMDFTHPLDVFSDPDWSILGANGIKVSDEVDKASTKPYETVLASLGIPGVGKSMARLIIPKIPAFRNLRDVGVVDIKGVGPSTVNAILTWLEENEDWVLQLPLQLEQDLTVQQVTPSLNKKVCITGKLDMPRAELTNILESTGYKVVSTVTKDCYALITAGDNSSSKYVKAVDMGITIVDYRSSKKEVLSGNF